MSFNITLNKSLAGLDASYSVSTDISGGAKLAVNETIATGTSDNLVNFEFQTGVGTALAMSTNTTYPITVKTNSSSVPINTFTFNNENTQIFTNFAGLNSIDSLSSSVKDITSLYVSNTGTTVLTFRANSLFDPTP